ncbi:HNH endonuclease [Alteromonas sp. H39]|uniref:HNH endonuclease n=1 Tax=Alteromonas sp. H39 TaxID=3389876 RepID=UPI0039E0F7C1
MLESYLSDFQKLNVDRSSGRAKPHKVCMLYAVMDLIEEGRITDNKIVYSPELKERFSHYFDKLKSEKDRCNPYLPFYHLKSSSFWHLQFREMSRQQQRHSINEASLNKYVLYAYLDSSLFELLKNKDYSQALREQLGRNLSELGEQFVRWAQEIGKKEKTAKNYLGALQNSIPNWSTAEGQPIPSLFEISSLSEFRQIATKLKQLETFKQKDSKGGQMYSAALRAYENFLADTTQVQLQEDIDEILLNKTNSESEKAALVKARIGQGKYRQELIDHWKQCALTGFKNRDFLIASHIKPWRASNHEERLDKFNGLLLVANIDKAFDKAYITFEDNGAMLIAEELEEYTKLGIDPSAKIALSPKHREYMAYHREVLFRR